MDSMTTCPTCKGTGRSTYTYTSVCPICRGTRYILIRR